MSQPFEHEPVMLREVREVFEPVDEGVFLDATLGGGGHARAILEDHPGIRLVGLDRDPDALAAARVTLDAHGGRVELRHAGFERLDAELDTLGVGAIDGVLFDLGVSSHQLDEPARGFSFRQQGPLDMRMDPTTGPTAADIVNGADEAELADLLRRHGDERHARRIARAIVGNRPLATTAELADVVVAAMPAASRRTPGHPARRTFQALRIAVNRELDVLGPALDRAIDRLRPGGRGAVLSYHSGEDRIVKRRLRAAAGLDRHTPRGLPAPEGDGATVLLLHRRGRTPDAAELARNPRASSARLRSFERVGPVGEAS